MADVRRIVTGDVRTAPCATRDAMLALATALWDGAEHREDRYAALAVCRHPRHRAFQDAACLGTYHRFVVTGAWWDLVDETSTLVGDVLVRGEPGVRDEVRSWAADTDMWLRRTSIICQRLRGPDTDPALLSDAIVPNLPDREFFIRKAIGWALRAYARTDPDWVRAFVAAHELSGLSRREALKHL